jgi:transposase
MWVSVSANQEESDMNATTVAVDLAKNAFQLAVADGHWHIVERTRLSRGQFERWFRNRAVGQVVMEACGSAHFWARRLQALQRLHGVRSA